MKTSKYIKLIAVYFHYFQLVSFIENRDSKQLIN